MPDDAGFSLSSLFSPKLPPPAGRFTGMPRYNFVGGHNDASQIPVAELAQAAESVLSENGALLAIYNLGHGPQGYGPLRDFVAEKLGGGPGIRCTREDVLITSGSLQGMDLVNEVLVAPGDMVILEEFTYGGAITKVQKLGANFIGAPVDEDGIRIDALRNILEDQRRRGVTPKYIYTIPTVQNPTGSIMPLERRKQLVELAREFGTAIFEDECYADLVWSGERPPALYSLDPSRVIHIGSFSKSLAPALRIGYAVAEWPALSRMIACKTDAGTGAIEQMIIADYFGREFEPHVRELKSALREKLDTMIEALEAEFGTAAELFVPKGGIFLWLKLPDHVDVRRLVKPAADAGLTFNPGPEWACDAEAAKSYMRLCFALPSKADIRDGVAELARICFEHTGVPVRSSNRQRA